MAIVIGDITTGVVGGTGDFDVLMTAAKAHLQEEYSSGRITGDKYAEAYISIMNAVLGTAVQFKLGSAQTDAQVALSEEQTKLIVAQTAQVTEETKNTTKQGLLLDAQLTLTGKQEDLVDQQILTETANTTDPTGGLTKAQFDAAVKQVDQLQSNIELTKQKVKTESAQILDTIDSATVAGTIGKQKAVYDAQIKGFNSDAVQKATKLMVDTWSVRRSTDETTQANDENNLQDTDVGKFIAELGKQVGVTIT